jgi:hypothetical protein
MFSPSQTKFGFGYKKDILELNLMYNMENIFLTHTISPLPPSLLPSNQKSCNLFQTINLAALPLIPI